MATMSEEERELANRAEKAVQAIKYYGLDPYTALWLTVFPTAKIRAAERGELKRDPIKKTRGKTLLPRVRTKRMTGREAA
jgi:hypothetical protein